MTACDWRISDWSSDVCSSDLLLFLLVFVLFAGPFALSAADALASARTGPVDRLRRRCGESSRPIGSRRRAPRPRAGAGLPGRLRLPPDRKSVVTGKVVSVRVDHDGSRSIKKKTSDIYW